MLGNDFDVASVAHAAEVAGQVGDDVVGVEGRAHWLVRRLVVPIVQARRLADTPGHTQCHHASCQMGGLITVDNYNNQKSKCGR